MDKDRRVQKTPGEARDLEPRRVPTQERSRQRVDAILDAFATLLVENGFEAVNTHMVAERAEVPVGTVYQFFPNKFALATACARRNVDLFMQLYQGYTAPSPEDVPFDKLIDRIMDFMSDALFANETVVQLWTVALAVPELREIEAEGSRVFLGVTIGLIQPYLPQLDEEHLQTVAATANHVAYALMSVACQEEAPQRGRTMAEMKRLIKAYVGSYIGTEQ